MEAECSICTDGLSGDGDIATQCGHVFHKVCLKLWLDRSKTCPQCRSNIDENKNIPLYFHSNSKTAVATPKASLKILSVQDFKKSNKLSRERELRTSVRVAIDSLTLLQDKIPLVKESEILAADSLRNSAFSRSLLSAKGYDPGKSLLENQLKTTEKKINEALSHIDVFREKMFVVSRSLVEVMDSLNLERRNINVTKPLYRKNEDIKIKKPVMLRKY